MLACLRVGTAWGQWQHHSPHYAEVMASLCDAEVQGRATCPTFLSADVLAEYCSISAKDLCTGLAGTDPICGLFDSSLLQGLWVPHSDGL